jgi:ankyrin repeat-rich membrane spanning protein
MKIFLPFTINLDPYLMKLVKEEVQTLEASKAPDSTRFPPTAQSPYRPVRVSLQQQQAGRAGGEWDDQLMRHIPANFARRKLSELSVSSVCALLTELLEEPEEGEEDGEASPEAQVSGHIEAAIRVIRSNHISGRVLAACDLDELRAVLGLNFGDWNLFRLAVLSLRQLDLSGQLPPEDATAGDARADVERRRKTAVMAARGPAVSSGVQASVPDPNQDTDQPDPRFFGPTGSGSFYHHAKIIRKILNPTIL